MLNNIKHSIIKFLAAIIVCCTPVFSFAQEAAKQVQDVPEMATGMRSSGMIYVVVLVIITIFIGIVGYLFALDRKITKLEQEQR